MPLVGFVPIWQFENDPATDIRSALLNPANFGNSGISSCSIDFKPFIPAVPDGSLIANGQKKYDVFFAGLSNNDLTGEEADEMIEFMHAGGIVYIAGGGYSAYQGLGIPGSDGSHYNRLFERLGIPDRFPSGEVIDFYFCGGSSLPFDTPIISGIFGNVGQVWHGVFNPINTSTLKSVATGFTDLCFIGMLVDPGVASVQSAQSGDYDRTILAEGEFEKGYLSVSGEPLYLWTENSENERNYFLNLFSLACPSGGSTTVEPFLDLPWDYEGKGLSFSEAAVAIGSYFDHEYPFVDVGSVLGEPPEARGTLTNYDGKFRRSDFSYSGHDGYDWFTRAKVKNGDSVLAAAAGTAQFFKAGSTNGACGSSACGNVVVIDHGNGYQSRYYHLQDNDPISQSFTTPRHVNAREVIGKVGSTGTKSTGPHIHFSVIQDKNNDGNFQDNRPDGLTDPFGWQSRDPDPWPAYTFNFRGTSHTGNTSNYLWIKPIANLSRSLPSNGGYFRLERFGVNFPENAVIEDSTIEMRYAPITTISDYLLSLGSVLRLDTIGPSGNPVSIFPENFTITIDFDDLDISNFNLNTLSIYSSPDGEVWTQEDTEIDLASGVATAILNHASYFALAAEKSDTETPVTEITMTGSSGDSGWFRSDVVVTLNSHDDKTDIDNLYTAYRIDENHFTQYLEPFTVSEEGEHTIEYYSVDESENIEEVKTVKLVIDKTSPELKLIFNKEKLNTEFTGAEVGGNVEVMNRDGLVKITDKAGNNTTVRGIFSFSGTQNSIQLLGISYGGGKEKLFDKNAYLSEYKSYPDGRLISIGQSWSYRNVGLPGNITTDYRTKTDSTRVRIKEAADLLFDSWLSGTHLLWVETNNGSLKYGYE